MIVLKIGFFQLEPPEKKAYPNKSFWAGLSTLLFFYPMPVQIFGTDGLLDLIVKILQILTGFYIASLAAVATFNKGDMMSI